MILAQLLRFRARSNFPQTLSVSTPTVEMHAWIPASTFLQPKLMPGYFECYQEAFIIKFIIKSEHLIFSQHNSTFCNSAYNFSNIIPLTRPFA